MNETVRCPSCRGAKKVPKLGGMIGECNTCKGIGTIFESDKVKVCIPGIPEVQRDLMEAVANAVPVSSSEKYAVAKQINKAEANELIDGAEEEIKIDPKKAIYKRKTVAK